MINSPVLFIFYNREDFALRVFEEIRKARPKILILSSDGPKNNKDKVKVFNLRKKILSLIDWDCRIFKFFYKVNLGFAKHIPQTLDKVFKKFDYLIYLEDDTLPNQVFFKFMDIALEKFKNDERIIGINGFNLGFRELKHDLTLTKLASIWGCGLYKRLWDLYDYQLKYWLKEKQKLKNNFYNKKIFFYFETYFDRIAKGDIFTWAIQILYSLWKYDKFFLVPKKNYIQNIGFEKGTSSFLFFYEAKHDNEMIKKFEVYFSEKTDEKFFDFLLRGGWIRLFLIRIYINSPKIIKHAFNFFVKVLNKLKKIKKS